MSMLISVATGPVEEANFSYIGQVKFPSHKPFLAASRAVFGVSGKKFARLGSSSWFVNCWVCRT